MKRYIQSLTGKIINYILCLIAIVVFCTSSLLTIYMVSTNYYTSNAEQIFEFETGNSYEMVKAIAEEYHGITEIDRSDVLYYTLVNTMYQFRYSILLFVIGSGIIALITLIFLMAGAGRSNEREGVTVNLFTKIPSDLMALLICCWFGSWLAIEADLYGYGVVNNVVLICFVGIMVAILPAVFMDFAVRVKTGSLFSNTIIWKVCKATYKGIKKIGALISEVFRNVNIMWKVIAALGIISFLEFIVIVAADDRATIAFFWVVEKLVLYPLIFWMICHIIRLFKAGDELAKGNLDYKTDISGMFGSIRQQGINLNSIGEGMSNAVEQRIKSERLKTELITNVSHDIKTPLTSIINYTGLIAAEDCENEKIKEYSEVLTRQSAKLKRLIEDLVEVSKASTGNLEVELVKCNASVFLEQISGEYEEKLSAKNLTLLVETPENPMFILADGRRMWRLFDNLMNNICKYSQPGTRVYAKLERNENTARFSFKNISAEPLNLTPGELMERFVRGDSSRNTEGNGLGLSIAESMATLQGGKLLLEIDGDLFKAIAEFPIVSAL